MIDQTNELPDYGLKFSPETSRYTENKWISRKKQIYTRWVVWVVWVVWVFKASRFFVKAFKIVNIRKSIQAAIF